MPTEESLPPPKPASPSRRDFLLKSAAAAATTAIAGCAATPKREPAVKAAPEPKPKAHVGKPESAPAIRPGGLQPDKIKIGLIGCGGRGTGAVADCLHSSPNIEVVALGDLVRDRVDECLATLTNKDHADIADKVQVKPADCHVGFDAYKAVLQSNIDLVLLATPPGFRPLHFEAAIKAGKHVFMEKPVAVDPVGVRRVIAAAEQADKKKLCVVTGTQRRHEPRYLETMKLIHHGAIGDIVAAQCYWNQGDLWVKPHKPEWSDMEWQCRNWLYFTWLSGDHIVEQHVHNLDVINWALKATPVKCVGLGGRQVRTAPEFGNIFDHFSIEYEYPNGVRVLSFCRQTKGCSDRVSERLVGTRGVADPGGWIDCGLEWKYEAPAGSNQNPYVIEHADLIDALRAGQHINEAKRVAESTLTAIMGRMSAYTGREVSWDWVMNSSQLDLTPPKYEFCDLPVTEVAVPGKTPLV